MSQRTRQSYSPEFKAEAVKLVIEQEQSVASVSRNLKISIKTLTNWVTLARSGQIVGTSDHDPRISALEAENKRLKEKITKLELKTQIDEHYHEGTSKNDKEYIAKMESTIKSQKSIIHSLSIQVQELQKEFGKVANVNSQ